jgi:hypothetical protein
VLSEIKVHYPQIKKIIYAVIIARRKLQHYFLGHPITVVSSFLLGEIIQNQEATGRIAKWLVELMGETLTYAPRKAIKSQALADFIAEWTETQLPSAQVQAELWTIVDAKTDLQTQRANSRFDLATDKGDNSNTLVLTTAIRPDALAKMYSCGT